MTLNDAKQEEIAGSSTTLDQEALAQHFLELVEGSLKRGKIKSDYIPLQIQFGKSTNNINAISVFRNAASFQVLNSSRLLEGQAFGLEVVEIFNDKNRLIKLRFNDLNLAKATEPVITEFFKCVAAEAIQAAKFRQGY